MYKLDLFKKSKSKTDMTTISMTDDTHRSSPAKKAPTNLRRSSSELHRPSWDIDLEKPKIPRNPAKAQKLLGQVGDFKATASPKVQRLMGGSLMAKDAALKKSMSASHLSPHQEGAEIEIVVKPQKMEPDPIKKVHKKVEKSDDEIARILGEVPVAPKVSKLERMLGVAEEPKMIEPPKTAKPAPATANSTKPMTQKPTPKQAYPSSDKVKKIQTEVDVVVDIMKSNIDKVVQRGEKLEHLKEKSEKLEKGAMNFKKTATAIKEKTWWEGAKLWITIALFVFCVIVILVIKYRLG